MKITRIDYRHQFKNAQISPINALGRDFMYWYRQMGGL